MATPIEINDSNKTAINEAIPVLKDAYTQIENFRDQIQTEVDNNSLDPTTLDPNTITVVFSGVDGPSSPALKEYTRWDIEIDWEDTLTTPAFVITKVNRTCMNTQDTSL